MSGKKRYINFVYYRHPAYYGQNDQCVDNKEELQKILTSPHDYPFHVVFPSCRDFIEVKNQVNEKIWRQVTALILDENNESTGNLPLLTLEDITYFTSKHQLKLRLHELIAKTLRSKLQRYMEENNAEMMTDTIQDLNEFKSFIASIRSSAANQSSQLPVYWRSD